MDSRLGCALTGQAGWATGLKTAEQQRGTDLSHLPLWTSQATMCPDSRTQAPLITPDTSSVGTQTGHLSGQDAAQNFPVDSHVHSRRSE